MENHRSQNRKWNSHYSKNALAYQKNVLQHWSQVGGDPADFFTGGGTFAAATGGDDDAVSCNVERMEIEVYTQRYLGWGWVGVNRCLLIRLIFSYPGACTKNILIALIVALS